MSELEYHCYVMRELTCKLGAYRLSWGDAMEAMNLSDDDYDAMIDMMF